MKRHLTDLYYIARNSPRTPYAIAFVYEVIAAHVPWLNGLVETVAKAIAAG